MKCDRCKLGNTEFSEFDMDVSLDPVKNRTTIEGSSWVKRLVIRYVNRLLGTDLVVKVKVCQTCQSKMFRKLDKDK